MSSSESKEKEFQIPIITMVDDETFNNLTIDSEIVKSLRHACEEIGFFYLKVIDSYDYENRQDDKTQQELLSPQLISNVFEQSKQFFDLPLHLKQQFVDSELNRGYTSMGEETLDPSNQTEGDTKEGYYIANDVPIGSPLYNPSKLSGPNVWPINTTTNTEMDLDCELWKQTMNEYFEKCNNIGIKLVQLLALAIGLPNKHYFDDKFDPPMAFLRLLHYSNQESSVTNGVFACGAHSDYGMVTLLATDDQPGLQILVDTNQKGEKKEEKWIDVAPPPVGTFVVNLGDMLERWTNGKFKSTVHRVLSSGSAERYSIPFFYEPNFDTVVECLDTCLEEGETPKYERTTAGGHLLEKYNQTHADFQQL